jgi:hypothetical protein
VKEREKMRKSEREKPRERERGEKGIFLLIAACDSCRGSCEKKPAKNPEDETCDLSLPDQTFTTLF